jgi:hypothetical protein
MLTGNLRRLVRRGKRRRIDWSGAPTWRPFAVCQREPVTTAIGENLHLAGAAAPASSGMNEVERPIFSNLSRHERDAANEIGLGRAILLTRC